MRRLRCTRGSRKRSRPARGRLRLEYTVGGRIGHAIESLIRPLGFNWRIGIGLIAFFVTREVSIDENRTNGGAGAVSGGTLDASNMLKLALAAGA